MVRINSRNHVIETKTPDMDSKTVKAPQELSTSESTYRKTITPTYRTLTQNHIHFTGMQYWMP